MLKLCLRNGKKSTEYKIKLTQEFLEEFDDICEYISSKLKNQEASNLLRQKVVSKVLLLRKSPKMFAKIRKISKTKKQYRRMVINNYVILYTIDDEEKNVYIMHIYYGERNYIDDLL